MEIIGGLISLALLLALYFLPTIIANKRYHNNTSAIVVTNIFLGWTVLGWIVALIWAFTNNKGGDYN